jgi:hypothetical protein
MRVLTLSLAAAAAAASASASALSAAPCSSIPAGAPWADCAFSTQPSYGPLPPTSATFASSDAAAQALFAHAEACAARNVVEMAPGLDVLVEGENYGNVWLETQPMGGSMFAVRNLTLALNNQLVFMRTQRADGRLPGMISRVGGGVVNPTYSWPGNANLSMLQGFYMASPAVDVAALVNLSSAGGGAAVAAAFLAELRPVLEGFEAWLWAERNSTDGVLWLAGTSDTGEDGSDKFAGASGPFESMDMMGYAFDAQRALARIARAQGDGAAEARWAARMAETAASLRAQLWRDDLGAAFDRERDGARVSALERAARATSTWPSLMRPPPPCSGFRHDARAQQHSRDVARGLCAGHGRLIRRAPLDEPLRVLHGDASPVDRSLGPAVPRQ